MEIIEATWIKECPCEACIAWREPPPQGWMATCQVCGDSRAIDTELCHACDSCLNGCCECWECLSCGNEYFRTSWRCRICDLCEGCCECLRCVNCGRRAEDPMTFKPCCGRCFDCPCDCNADPQEILQRLQPRIRTAQKQYYERINRAMAAYKGRTRLPLSPITYRYNGKTVPRVFTNSEGLMFFKSRLSQHVRNPSRRFISVEMEIAGCHKYLQDQRINPLYSKEAREVLVAKWPLSITEDISVPENTGFEINTFPMEGDRFVDMVEDVCRILKYWDATCLNFFDRRKRIHCCGLHVHTDARDIDYLGLRRILLLYERIEPELFAMLPGYRRASHYCPPCAGRYGRSLSNYRDFLLRAGKGKGAGLARQAIIASAYGSGTPNREDKRSCPLPTRYRALNLHAFFYRGTLEYRQMYGTIDPADIIPWAILMAAISDSALKLTSKKLNDILNAVPSQEILLDVVCPNQELRDFVIAQQARFAENQLIMESPYLMEVDKARYRYYELDGIRPAQAPKREAEARRNEATFTLDFGNPAWHFVDAQGVVPALNNTTTRRRRD